MNEDVAKKHAALVESLYKRTNNKSIKWEMSGNRDPRANLGSYSIILSEARSGGSPVELLTVLTQFDEMIETVNDEDLAELTPRTGNYDSYFPLMEDLRSLAFRQAVGADKALDDLLGQLNDDFD